MVISAKIDSTKKELKRPIIPLFLLIGIITFGTLGFYLLWIEQENALFDAFYMVALTITTVGYNEVHPLDGYGRALAIVVSFVGIGSLFFIFSVMMENIFNIESLKLRSRKKMLKKIEDLENHFIIVGFGRVGTLAANELVMRKEDFVVVDNEIKDNNILAKSEIMGIEGNASEDDTLQLANIKKAKSIIVTTGNPATTVFVVITAKQLNPDIYIVARADDESVSNKLIRAGADKVVNPYAAGGYKMASLAVNPTVVDFFDSNLRGSKNGFDIEMIQLSDESPFNGKTLKGLDLRKKTGASIIGVIRDDERILNPGGEFIFEEGDKIIIMGNLEQIQSIEKIVNSQE